MALPAQGFVGYANEKRRPLIIGLVILALFAGVYALLPQFADLRPAFAQVKTARPIYLFPVLCLIALSYLSAVFVYKSLVPRRLKIGRTYLVQIAASCAGKIFPAGTGTIGVSYLYLRREGLPASQAAAMVTANNTLGVIGNLIFLVAAIVWLPDSKYQIHPDVDTIIIAIILVAVAALLVRTWGGKLKEFISEFLEELTGLIRQPRRLIPALAFSIILTSCYALVLMLSASAVGASTTFPVALAALSAGVILGGLSPTPGGLGAMEAGAVGVLTTFNVPFSGALAAVVLYRLATFWLPLVVGAGALALAIRRKYI